MTEEEYMRRMKYQMEYEVFCENKRIKKEQERLSREIYHRELLQQAFDALPKPSLIERIKALFI
jgi:hypothetical protein